jgi:hypothetical protein
VAEIASVTGSVSLCSPKKQYAVKPNDAKNIVLVHPDTGRRFTTDLTCLGTLSPQTKQESSFFVTTL